MIVTAEFHRCFQIWKPSGVEVAISSFGTRAISEEINCRFGLVVAGGLAVASSEGFGLGLGGMSLIVETNVVKDSRRAKKLKILALIDSDQRAD